MFKHVLFLIAATLMFASCKEEVKTEDLTGVPIIIRAEIETRAGDTYFEEGDEIGLTIKTLNRNSIVDNHPMVYEDSYFVSDLTWYDKGISAEFIAYYPYRRVFSDEFAVKTQQNDTDEGYYAQSDLMLARLSNVKPNINGVPLQFAHAMSLIIVQVNNESNTKLEGVSLNNTIITATVDYDGKKVRVKDGATPDVIWMCEIEENAYKALVVPQAVELEISVETEEGLVSTIKMETTHYEQGKKYNIYVNLDEDMDLTDVEIIGGSDIDDWEPGGTVKPKE